MCSLDMAPEPSWRFLPMTAVTMLLPSISIFLSSLSSRELTSVRSLTTLRKASSPILLLLEERQWNIMVSLSHSMDSISRTLYRPQRSS